MNREIKFRAFDGVDYVTKPFTLLDIQNGKIQFASSDTKIMQFTGLKDSTGADIYEGDVLQTQPQSGENVNQIVEFIDGCFRLKAISSYVHRETRDWAYSCAVIGNIYQNPELLESVQK